MTQNKVFDINQFVRDLETNETRISGHVVLKGLNGNVEKKVDLKVLTRELLENNLTQFSPILFPRQDVGVRTVDRVYSRNEIKKIVIGNLISEYQHPKIVEAVTDYLYEVHVNS